MDDSCTADRERIAGRHAAFAAQIREMSAVKEVRQLGTILAIELQTHSETTYTNNIRKKVYSFFLERNILLRPLGNVLYIVPPYIISDEQLENIYSAITELTRTLTNP
jgi:adenosylmethionine-8-amino-7-oxononanoate aminotransferase